MIHGNFNGRRVLDCVKFHYNHGKHANFRKYFFIGCSGCLNFTSHLNSIGQATEAT